MTLADGMVAEGETLPGEMLAMSRAEIYSLNLVTELRKGSKAEKETTGGNYEAVPFLFLDDERAHFSRSARGTSAGFGESRRNRHFRRLFPSWRDEGAHAGKHRRHVFRRRRCAPINQRFATMANRAGDEL